METLIVVSHESKIYYLMIHKIGMLCKIIFAFMTIMFFLSFPVIPKIFIIYKMLLKLLTVM